jgi:hypothetical protein
MSDQLFDSADTEFTFVSHGVTLSVKRFNLPGYVAFEVEFSSKRKPIIIARALDANLGKFWTAVPEGQHRETEAKGVGKLIEEYIKNID